MSCVRCSLMVSCLDMGPRFRVWPRRAHRTVRRHHAEATERSCDGPARLGRRHGRDRSSTLGRTLRRDGVHRARRRHQVVRHASQALGPIDLDGRRRRGRHRARAERQRQDDAAAARRRPRRADAPARSSSTATSPHDARAAKRIGFVPQSPALLPWRTVAANARLLLDVNRRVAGTPGARPARPARRGRSGRLRRRVPARAVGRHAAARGPGPGDGPRRARCC